MANIVERLKGFKSIPEGEQKVNVCAQHGEKLQLFCKKDMMAICWVCERSQEHHGHQTALIEEVDHEYKVRSRRVQETKHKTVTDGKAPLCVTRYLPAYDRLET
jgi:tripartite motif-containing protein 5